MRGLFVTGTDTGIGKTFVSCAILQALRARGHRVGVYKPCETGCSPGPDGVLRGDDCARLAAAADTGQLLTSVATALYPIPAAPLVAAEAEGEAIEPDVLLRECAAIADRYGSVLVEGAGGLLVPIAPGFTFADFAEQLGLPVLVVVGSKLGCLNHALLTLSELEGRGLRIAGYVVNDVEEQPEAVHAVATHREVLARFAHARDLGALPHAPVAALDESAAQAARHLDLAAIESAMELAARLRAS